MTDADEVRERTTPITVLGVGNPIMGDDGVGLELLARLQERCPGSRAEWVDGGTGGLALVPVVAEAARLLVLDSVAAVGVAPGTVLRLSGDGLRRALASKLSPHQVGLLDVLAAVRLLGSEPDEVEVVGVVPESVELRLGLSPVVRDALPPAVDAAAAVLDEWLAGTAAGDPMAGAGQR